MDWTEISVTVDAKDMDTAAAVAQMTVPWGIYVEDYSHLDEEIGEIAHVDLIGEELLQKDRAHAVVHVYVSPEETPAEAAAFLTERLSAAGVKHEIRTAPCVQEDWINNWKKYFHPIKVGEKLLIRPDWEQAQNPDGRIVLSLEPGIAFGTGTHETTRLCLELLEKAVRPGCAMLDIGCGSGILSTAGLLLGAKSAVGVDIDPLAVKTAVQNAERNRVQDRFTGVCGNLTDRISGKYDVVAANIVADVIIDLVKDLPRYLAPGAVCIFSGIITERETDVLNALAGRFTVLERREEKGWLALSASSLL